MLVGGILLYVFRHKVEPTVRNGMESTIRSYKTNKDTREAWDEIQTAFRCCGVYNYTDWRGDIPDTCCAPVTPGKPTGPCHSTSASLYKEGCFSIWPDFIKKNAAVIGGVGIGVACIMVSFCKGFFYIVYR